MRSHPHLTALALLFESLSSLSQLQLSSTAHTFSNPYPKHRPQHTNFTMPYPETAEGFMIESQKNWTDFKKQEVCDRLLSRPLLEQFTDQLRSSSSSLSRTATLTLPLTPVVSALQMSTPSLVVGVRLLSHFVLVTRLLAAPSRSARM